MRLKHLSIVIILFSFITIPYFLSLSSSDDVIQLESIENYDFEHNTVKSAGDGYGYIDTANHQMFWFIQIADTQHIWYNDDSMAHFRYLLSNTRDIVKPEFFILAGDIVDSDYENTFGKNERDQRIEEWQNYNEIITDTGMDISFYFDLMGNHDAYGDPGFSHYMNYSIVGKETGKTQIAWEKKYNFGDYAFIGLHTAEDRGVQYPYQVFGYLNRAELDWFEQKLETYKDYDLTFTFGHHPAFEINSQLSSSLNTFIGLCTAYGVDFYGMGHGHHNTYDNSFGTFCVETESFDNEERAFRIIAVDNNKISSSVEYVNRWPHAVITAPVSQEFTNEGVVGTTNIRVLAWDKNGVNKVSWSAWNIFGEMVVDWTDMVQQNGGPLWEGPWNNTLETGNRYIIKAKIEGGSEVVIREISFSSMAPIRGFTIFNVIVWSFIAFFALITLLPARVFILRKRYPEKYGKKPDQLVSRKLAKLYLIKVAIFFLLPVSFGFPVHGELEAFFPFFTVSITGIHFYSLNLIFGGVGFLLSVMPQGFRLSKGTKWRFQADTIISLVGIGLMLYFHGGHYAISFIAPALYGMIIMDILMFNATRKDETYR